MRAVVYARYSSDQQRATSIDDQIRLCKERVAREGWKMVQVYRDTAMSGATAFRPGYQAMLEGAREAAFDVVVTESLDRLSRDQEDVAALYKRLGFLGIRIVTLAEGEISELHVYLKDLAQKTRRGREGRVRQGRSGGGLCYGYDVVRETDARGEPVRGGRTINEAEAAVVRRIFAEYAAGRAPRAIARGLNADGIRGPFGGTWSPSTINGNAGRGTGILNNELYAGRLVWNRLRYSKDPNTGKRRSRLNPKSAWVEQPVPELRIVDEALWQRVKERQLAVRRDTRPDARQPAPFWAGRRARYLFSGLIKCGACGGNYVVISKHLYGCARARDRGTCANLQNIRRDVLEATVLDGLKSRLMDPALFQVFADEFVTELNRLRAAAQAQRRALEDENASIERRLRKLVEAIADGVSARTLKDELLRLEARQQELGSILAKPAETRPLIHPALAAIYRRKVAELHQALQQDETRAEAAEILRGLIDEITLVPQGDGLRVDLKGALAGILQLAADGKKPAAMGDGLEQIKVVAGKCNHRRHTVCIAV